MRDARQRQIVRMHGEIRRRIEAANRDMMQLQALCQHPDAEKKHGSNTGNYDPSADSYWTDYNCPDCSKRWSREGSQ